MTLANLPVKIDPGHQNRYGTPTPERTGPWSPAPVSHLVKNHTQDRQGGLWLMESLPAGDVGDTVEHLVDFHVPELTPSPAGNKMRAQK